MTTARKQQVSVDATPYYHCVSRCVRRSFLCGVDPLTEKNFEHRREWIKQKLYSLSQIYCIDICAYAIMSNHYHLVLHINREKALSLSDHDVVQRWQKEHKLPNLVANWLAGQLTCETQKAACASIINSWRSRLWSLSWFMRELNFYISCKANQEDECKGHFWESRFKSQALLDEQALVAAMTYVDLNPLRAGTAKTPEESEFTSIRARLEALKNHQVTAPCLHPFVGNSSEINCDGIPFRLLDYIELVDWTARQYRNNKARLDSTTPPILQRLNINQTVWLKVCRELGKARHTVISSTDDLHSVRRLLNKTRIHRLQLTG